MPAATSKSRSKGGRKPEKNPGKKQKPAVSEAATRDRHVLYQEAVQCVEAEIDFVDETFRALTGRKAVTLREDFAGTANTSCEWVRRDPGNTAYALDLDPDPLEWGRANNLAALSPDQQARAHLLLADVRTPPAEAASDLDTILAMNFSYWLFETRAAMLEYFRSVRSALKPDGVFFLDFMGGTEAFNDNEEDRDVESETGKDFVYTWTQKNFNPIDNTVDCAISFKFKDSSKMKDAFTYRWRVWTIPEIREILADAGFGKTTVYWEGDDGDGGGDGVFTATERGEACESFICYLSAQL